MSTVLIASLGESPVVVTAMFDLLKNEENIDIDQLTVFYTISGFSLHGYENLIYPSLHHICKVKGIEVDAEDVSSENASFNFLRQLYRQLDEHQRNGDTVYLSLAGGRKSMAALMGFLAPFFSCVKRLHHILDRDEGKKRSHFLSARRIFELPTEEDKQRYLFPTDKQVTLISIPYGEPLQFSDEDKSFLQNPDAVWERNAEQAKAVIFNLALRNDQGEIMSVLLTKKAANEYRKILRAGGDHATEFAKCFYEMRFENHRNGNAHLEPHRDNGRTFRFYKRAHHDERPVFHIETTETKRKFVVVSALPIEVQGRSPAYPPLKTLVKYLEFPLKTEELVDVEELEKNFSQEDEEAQEDNKPKELILIVPLGTSPMVATQLYQLYRNKGKEVHSVILVHTKHKEVRKSVNIACDAFKDRGVTCNPIPLEGWEDIDETKACIAYQELLEKIIEDTRKQNPSCQIELTISGGRKGIAALTIFAAQHSGIHHVVHTVIQERIIDEKSKKTISDKINEETQIKELINLVDTNNKKKRNDRLFLEAYKEYKDDIVLFDIPVRLT